MATEKQRKTFLSYSRNNKDFAIRLGKELKSEGFDVWLDQLDIPAGSRWDREVEKALKESDIFMIILTPASVDSENVLDEIGYAIDHGKQFLPVLLENCDVPLRLRRFQYVDFTNKDFDDGVESAKDLLRALIAQTTIPRGTVVTDQQVEGDQKAKEDADRKAKEEADRLTVQKANVDRKAKEEADRKAKEDAERLAAQKVESDRKAKAEVDRKAKEEADRLAKIEADRKAKEEADRLAAQKAEMETKAEEKAKLAETRSDLSTQKKQMPKGLVYGGIGLALVVVLGIGYGIVSILGAPAATEAPVYSDPVTEAPVFEEPAAPEAPAVSEPEFDISGTWTGPLDQSGTIYDMELNIDDQFAGQIIFDSGSEQYQIQDNYWDGYDFHFSESEGRHFWGMLEDGHLIGYAAWDCYVDCGYWGTFDLSVGAQVATEEPVSDNNLIFEDDFSELNSMWPEDDQRYYGGNGYYYIYAEEDTVSMSSPNVVFSDFGPDLGTQVAITYTPNGYAGVYCRNDQNGAFYLFQVIFDSSLVQIWYNDGSNWDNLAEQSVNLSDSYNYIIGVCQGDSLDLYWNGEYAIGATDNRLSGTGEVGIYTESHEPSGTTVEFDDFYVFYP